VAEMGNSFGGNETGLGVKVVGPDIIGCDNYGTRTGTGLTAVRPGWEWERQQQEQDRTANDTLVPCQTLSNDAAADDNGLS